MPLVLLRVDERLIHGQVVLGWGSQLRPERYLVVDDDLAGSAWEQELYRLGAGEADVVFARIEEARAALPGWREASARSILLVRDVATLGRLAEGAPLEGGEVNLGGQHHGPDRRQALTYLHLSGEDEEILARLAEQGIELWAQDLPDAPRVSLPSLLGD